MTGIAAIVGSVVFIVAIVFYVLVTLGMPLGEFLMGGKYRILPPKMRVMTAVSVFIQILAVLVLLQGGGVINMILPVVIIKPLCYIFAVYFSLNVIMNLFSNSNKERMLMTPLSFITAICFWIIAVSL